MNLMRKILIGLIFGSLQFVYVFGIPFILYDLLRFPDNFPLLPDWANMPVFLTGIGILGGGIGLLLLGYKSKKHHFFWVSYWAS